MEKRSDRNSKKIVNNIFLILIALCILLVVIYLVQAVAGEVLVGDNLLSRAVLVSSVKAPLYCLLAQPCPVAALAFY